MFNEWVSHGDKQKSQATNQLKSSGITLYISWQIQIFIFIIIIIELNLFEGPVPFFGNFGHLISRYELDHISAVNVSLA